MIVIEIVNMKNIEFKNIKELTAMITLNYRPKPFIFSFLTPNPTLNLDPRKKIEAAIPGIDPNPEAEAVEAQTIIDLGIKKIPLKEATGLTPGLQVPIAETGEEEALATVKIATLTMAEDEAIAEVQSTGEADLQFQTTKGEGSRVNLLK